MVESFKSHLFKSKFAKYNLLKIRGGRFEDAFLCGWSCEAWDALLYIPYYKGKKNYANYTQTLHLMPHLSDSPRVTKCIVCAANPTQTLH